MCACVVSNKIERALVKSQAFAIFPYNTYAMHERSFICRYICMTVDMLVCGDIGIDHVCMAIVANCAASNYYNNNVNAICLYE